VKTIAWMTLLLAALATSALASDTVSHPFSHSPEALFLAEEGILARGVDEGAGCG